MLLVSQEVLLTEISTEKAKYVGSTFVPDAVPFTPLAITVEQGTVGFGERLVPNRSSSFVHGPDFFLK